MSKNILIISASPRKGGNSDTLCDEFLRGAMDSGNNAEKIFLRDKGINYCTGCGVCNNTHKCVQKDDMAEILDKMVNADVIVLATPVYFYTMDAQLKTLIDRTVPRYTEISGKEFYFIVTAADTDKSMLEKTVDGLRGFTEDCLSEPIEKGVIYASGVWQKGEVKSTEYMKQAYEMGRNS
ncbi:MAG: flavodoxin family protein [Oscillospiraceae bacterium]